MCELAVQVVVDAKWLWMVSRVVVVDVCMCAYSSWVLLCVGLRLLIRMARCGSDCAYIGVIVVDGCP